MRKKLKAWITSVITFFDNSRNRLFCGVALLLTAFLVQSELITSYTNIYVGLVIKCVWILAALFYCCMSLYVKLRRRTK